MSTICLVSTCMCLHSGHPHCQESLAILARHCASRPLSWPATLRHGWRPSGEHGGPPAERHRCLQRLAGGERRCSVRHSAPQGARQGR
eukprot:10762953-Lingulodinium_polyedra.AAC.1